MHYGCIMRAPFTSLWNVFSYSDGTRTTNENIKRTADQHDGVEAQVEPNQSVIYPEEPDKKSVERLACLEDKQISDESDHRASTKIIQMAGFKGNATTCDIVQNILICLPPFSQMTRGQSQWRLMTRSPFPYRRLVAGTI
ncbi:uncharacterized protein LOC111080834 [Drosophila obscura]|uniref:uncharacterized protein LOC111080834 n=1 Tax=Drosophila obscura TaxID=7282 RepID=UPI001BB29EC3|nr:uncharacterized protein LOC111080834 [Drosophila obscura]